MCSLQKTIICFVPLLMLSVFHPLSIAAEENRPSLSLRETFDIYVRAVHNSDLKGLFTTVTKNEKFFFLTSTGKLIDTRQDYYKFHEDWF